METSVCCDCRLVDTKAKADWIYVYVHSMILFTARSEAVIQACNWCYSVLAKAFLFFSIENGDLKTECVEFWKAITPQTSHGQELESTEEKLENLNSESVPVNLGSAREMNRVNDMSFNTPTAAP